MASLNFKFEEPVDEPLCTDFFNIISPFLQPDSQTSVQETANEILKLLPQNDPVTEPAAELTFTAIQVASQVPYTHPSNSRLAQLIACVLNSQEFAEDPSTIGKVGTLRYAKFNGEVRDFADEQFDLDGYVNVRAFLAHVYSTIWKEERNLGEAIWELRAAFEETHKDEDRLRYTMGATQWILIYGDAISEAVKDPDHTDDPDLTIPGPLYPDKSAKKGLGKLVASLTSKDKSRKVSARERWNFWREKFESIASGAGIEEKEKLYSAEGRSLCHDAAVRMKNLKPAS